MSLNTTDDMVGAASSEIVRYDFWVAWNSGSPIVLEQPVDGGEAHWVEFWLPTREAWDALEHEMTDTDEVPGTPEKVFTYNYMRMRKRIVAWFLKGWSLPVPVERGDNSVLANQREVMRVHPRILRHVVGLYEERVFLPESERNLIARQSVLLFGKHSKGVSQPHDAISLYCDLNMFWEKFGLDYFALQKLPNDVYVKLRTVARHEIEIKGKQAETAPKPSGGRPAHPASLSYRTTF